MVLLFKQQGDDSGLGWTFKGSKKVEDSNLYSDGLFSTENNYKLLKHKLSIFNKI